MNLETLQSKEEILKKLSLIKKNPNQMDQTDFDAAFEIVFAQLRTQFGFRNINLLLLDKTHENLIAYKLSNPDLSPDIHEKLYPVKIPMTEEGGICVYSVQEKKTVYLPDIQSDMVTNPISVKIFEMTGMKSNLIIPLIADNTIFGLITLPSYIKKLQLSEEQIEKVSEYVFFITTALSYVFQSIKTNH